MKYSLIAFLSVILGLSTTCSGISDVTSQSQSTATPSPPAVVASPKVQPSPPDSPIRRIDFANFTFPKLASKKCNAQSVTLHDGRYDAPEDRVPRKLPSVDCWSVALSSVTYGDVTGDNQEEAIVMLYAELGGTEEGVGACCPKHFTRTRYHWAGGRFQQTGKQEVFPNPSESSAIVNP